MDFFGLETLTVTRKEPERLLEVPSIGQKRVEKITQTWQEQLHIKEIMLFLHLRQSGDHQYCGQYLQAVR